MLSLFLRFCMDFSLFCKVVQNTCQSSVIQAGHLLSIVVSGCILQDAVRNIHTWITIVIVNDHNKVRNWYPSLVLSRSGGCNELEKKSMIMGALFPQKRKNTGTLLVWPPIIRDMSPLPCLTKLTLLWSWSYGRVSNGYSRKWTATTPVVAIVHHAP